MLAEAERVKLRVMTRTEPIPGETDGLPPRLRRQALLTLGIAIAMSVLDVSIANIALPTIARELEVSPAVSVWVVNAYQLAVTVSLLPLASLGEIVGYRLVYRVGLAVFTAASLVSALSTSLPMLIVGRMLEGFGAAGIMSVNTALVRFVMPRAKLGQGIGLTALVVATSSASGPTVAAAVLAVAPWPFLFAINVPTGLLALYLALRALPATPSSGHRFDPLGAAMNAATFGLFIVAVNGIGQGFPPALVAGGLALAFAIGFFHVRRQLARPAPLLPVDLFRLPVFALSVATSICSYAAQTLAYLALPFYFHVVGGLSQTRTGLLMTPWPAIVVLIAPIAGRLSDRYPAGLLGGLGLAVLTVGLLLLLTMPADADAPAIVWRMLLCGAGFGFFQSPNNRAIIGAAPRERSGAGSGMLSTARLLGQSAGGACVALAFGLTGNVGAGATVAIGLGAAFAAVGTVVSVLRLRPVRPG